MLPVFEILYGKSKEVIGSKLFDGYFSSKIQQMMTRLSYLLDKHLIYEKPKFENIKFKIFFTVIKKVKTTSEGVYPFIGTADIYTSKQ